MWFKSKRVYLDYAAATPVRKEVLEVMVPYWNAKFGNASSIHQEGQEAKKALEDARESVGRSLRVRPSDILYTSGGTESNNLAIKGVVKALKAAGLQVSDIEIISTQTEHPSVAKVLEGLKEEGAKVLYAPINEEGLVILSEFNQLLSPKTRLVTLAYANSETGVVQDLARIGRAIREYEKENDLTILFHTDASQAPLWLPCALDALFVDMMTLDAGKCFGPKGVGVLVKRPKANLLTTMEGGSQEQGLRPGTESLPLIVGGSTAIVLAQKEMEQTSKAITKMRDWWIKKLLKLPGVLLNGSSTDRIANNVNISVPGLDTEFAVVTLDVKGVAASTKSACGGAEGGHSEVVMTMTEDKERASSTIRFTLGPKTTYSDLKRATTVLREYLDKMRSLNFDPK